VAQGYAEAEDPSIYVRLPLVDQPGRSLLVWTTTPWTLPGNVAVAAHPEVEYAVVQRAMPEGGREYLIVAHDLVEAVFGDEPVRVVETFPGKKMKGWRYQPLFTFLHPDRPAYYVVLQDYVTTEDGTGLVHTAPAFGAEDLNAALEFDLPVLMTVAEDGTFIEEVRPWSGKFVKEADPHIISDLRARGLLYRAGRTTHTYPFCWRCDTPLLYYARGTWYIRTSAHKDRLVSLNQEINWTPEHFRDGRFGNWLENNVDWALGRERYWGTPLPVWECGQCRHQLAVGSLKELSELTGRDLSDLELHRPYVDKIKLACPECKQGRMTRVPELIDVWFDSGAMPVAQWHYPFENRDVFRRQFPADFICEAVDQTRGWFYSLHAISTLLFDQVAFNNVICLGLMLDADGQKMSKSRGNIVDPWDVFNVHGADAFRWYLYTATPPGQERRFSVELVGGVIRDFTLPLWNVYSFFVTYANLDGWSPFSSPQGGRGVRGEGGGDSLTEGKGSLDRWLISELSALVEQVTNALENYDVTSAARPLQAFIDTLSKWYLRRSRRRFWRSTPSKGGYDADKESAYATLYYTLLTLSKLLAPLTPFLAENLYQNLVRSFDREAKISVHLTGWPLSNPDVIDENLNKEMQLVMKLASLGHAARERAGIKVRQPLAEAAFWVGRSEENEALERHAELLANELNVKSVRSLGSAGEVVSYRLKPLPKQLGSKYQSLFPKVREALLDLEADQAASRLLEGKSIQVTVDGIHLEIQPDEVEVHAEGRSGLAVASEGAYLAALKTELTQALQREGLAREFVRRVQELRKEAGFEIADRIHLYLQGTSDLLAAVESLDEYVMGETLALELHQVEPPEEAVTSEVWFEGQWMKVGVVRA
jgi:isoleucyl-tRNA synthetase